MSRTISLPVELRRTFREQWPHSLGQLAIPAVSCELEPHEIDYLAQYQPSFRKAPRAPFQAECPSLLKRIQSALDELGHMAFPRIGYCSWKASIANLIPCRTAREVLAVVCTADERVDRGLRASVVCEEPVWLHLVQWRDMHTMREVRLFIRNGVLVGASAYAEDPQQRVEMAEAARVRDRIRRFSDELIPCLHVNSVVADVCVHKAPSQTVELIELNPFSRASDACHFEWRSGFDSTLRFLDCRLAL